MNAEKKKLVSKLEFLLQNTKMVNNGRGKTQDYSVLLALRAQLHDHSAKTTSKIAAVFLFWVGLRDRLTVKQREFSRFWGLNKKWICLL